VHYHSERNTSLRAGTAARSGRVVKVNSSAMPKGPSPARRPAIRASSRSHRGTLFLDEGGSYPCPCVKLNRALRRRDSSGGRNTPFSVDVAHHPATIGISRPRFRPGGREDLFYRLHVFPIRPALRETTRGHSGVAAPLLAQHARTSKPTSVGIGNAAMRAAGGPTTGRATTRGCRMI